MPGQQRMVTAVSLNSLFSAFLKVALFGGSGLVWARRIAVEQQQWITEEEFTDILGICQFMPGPNIVGIAVCTGAKLRGLAGAVAAASGFVLIPLTIGFMLGMVYLNHAHLGALQNVLGGTSAAAAGLLIATGIRMLLPYLRRPPALIVAACAFGGMSLTQLPLLVVLVGTALLSIVITATDDMRMP